MILKIIIPIMISLFLVSCGMSENDVKRKIEITKKSNISKMEELPKLKEYPQISYESEKLNDPFDLPIGKQSIVKKRMQQIVVKAQERRPDLDRPREYLENYSLDSLIMVGTLKRRGEMWALIVDKNGIIHKVKEGNYLGQNSGKIKKITEKHIDLDELISDQQGGWTTRGAHLNIKE